MHDTLTIFQASQNRKTYFRLNRPAGSALLDELIAITWEDFGLTDDGKAQNTFDSNCNLNGMDDVEDAGEEWDNLSDVCPGGYQIEPTRLWTDDPQSSSWALVEQAATPHLIALWDSLEFEESIISEERGQELVREWFGLEELYWTPVWVTPKGWFLVNCDTNFESLVR